jgi:hypothetical protein
LNIMAASKGKKKSASSSGGGAQQFLVQHGEKIVVGVIVVVALWFALQGLGHQGLSWQPDELVQLATGAEGAIKDSTRSAEDEGISSRDYAAYAEQIKDPIPVEPYRVVSLWLPPLKPAVLPPAAPRQPTAPTATGVPGETTQGTQDQQE